MSVSGLCGVCDRPELDHGCERCGQLVCDRHWDEALNVCVECSIHLERREQEPDRERPDGVDINRF